MEQDQGITFLKGHGTENDFVIIPDVDALLDLTPSRVAAICDRHSGIGADGVLRVVPARTVVLPHLTGNATWFMDYRNADGSIAEMCGNGARVFARFLVDEGWETGVNFMIATRAGEHSVTVRPDGVVSVSMGPTVVGPAGPEPMVSVAGVARVADPWWIPNPHAVVFVDDLDGLECPLPPPIIEDNGRFPDGQNVEYVVDLSTPELLHARIRIHERGVGETRSCGTGVCAVSFALRKAHSVSGPGTSIVDVPGGRLWVEHDEADGVRLVGPTQLVARGTISQAWWEKV